MNPQVYLIVPADFGPERLAASLPRALALPGAAALLLPRGSRSDEDYAEIVVAVSAEAQPRDIAVLIEGPPPLVRALGVDGLHLNGGTVAAVREAVSALKPDFIVGAGGIRSRHEAMQKGDAGVDYILFGPLSGPISAADRELARWWAETMEVPSVLCDPEAASLSATTEGCEFVGLNIAALEPAP